MSRLTHALQGERFERHGRAGRLSYYRAGDGPPLLLVHSINAAGSAYEIKPLFDRLCDRFTVYAPDLPGFGFSDRSARRYDVRLYVEAIHDMRERIDADLPAAVPDVLALSLSSEFVARAALEAPAAFSSLALVTPTGFTARSDTLRAPPGATREMKWLSAVLEFPLWRRGLYGLLVRPAVIRYFLKRTFGSDNYDPGLAAYDDLTTHQPGAENAPYAFLSGRLFSRDIRDVYERLELPVWLPHGTRGDFKDFRGADWARQRDNWRVQAYDTGALPHFELPEAFVDAYLEFHSWAHGG
jgi:pimeloyl-ACP methyl ester carboxylesterase